MGCRKMKPMVQEGLHMLNLINLMNLKEKLIKYKYHPELI